jgi:hypothetical protein
MLSSHSHRPSLRFLLYLSNSFSPNRASNREIVTTIPTIGEFFLSEEGRGGEKEMRNLFSLLSFRFRPFPSLSPHLSHSLSLTRLAPSPRKPGKKKRLQRRDRRVQEHLLHRVGRRRPGQGKEEERDGEGEEREVLLQVDVGLSLSFCLLRGVGWSLGPAIEQCGI